MAGLGGLAFVGQGYEQGLEDFMKVQQARDEMLGRAAFGRTLQLLNGGGQAQAPQFGVPQIGPGVPPAGGGMPPAAGAGGPMPGPAAGATPAPAPGTPPMAVRPAAPMMAPGPRPPAYGPAPQAGGPSGGMPMGGGGGGGGGFDWRQVLQAVVKANPGAPPSVIGAAVDQFLPIMNAQAQMQWREQSLMLREQSLQMAQQRFNENQDRLRDNATNLDTYRRDTLGERKRHDEQTEETATGRLEESRRSHTATEALRDQGQKNQMERFRQSLEVRKDVLGERIRADKTREQQHMADQLSRAQQSETKGDLDILHQQNRALWEHTNREIQISTNITDPQEKARLKKENDDAYMQVEDNISTIKRQRKGRSSFDDRFKGAEKQTGGLEQRRAVVPVPDQYKNDPDGTVLHDKDGNSWVKRGDQMVPQEAQ